MGLLWAFIRYSERASIQALRIFRQSGGYNGQHFFLGQDQSVNFESNYCYNVIVGLRPLKGPM